MLGGHVVLPEVAGFPDFEEEEVGGVLVVLVHVVLHAAFFGAGDVDELGQFGLYQINLAGFGFDVCDDGESCHDLESFGIIPGDRELRANIADLFAREATLRTGRRPMLPRGDGTRLHGLEAHGTPMGARAHPIERNRNAGVKTAVILMAARVSRGAPASHVIL